MTPEPLTPEQLEEMRKLLLQHGEVLDQLQEAVNVHAFDVQKAFTEVITEIRTHSLQIAEYRYFIGEISPIDFMRGLQEFRKHEQKSLADLDAIEIIEDMNKRRDVIYKRIVEGYKDNEKSTQDH